MGFELPDGYDDIVPEKTWGKPKVDEIFDFWESVMGYPIMTNKGKNRQYIAIMLKNRSAEQIKEHIALVAASRREQFAPQISSFADLYYKWDRLTEFCIRHQAKSEDILEI